MNWRRVLTETALLMIAALLISTGVNAIRSDDRKLAWRPHLVLPPKDPSLIFADISSDQALKLHRAGVLFIDARRSSFYEQSHVARALNIPVWEHDVDARVAALKEKGVRPEDPIVVYCSGGKCEDAVGLANRLAAANYCNLYVYKEGFPDWQARRWPVIRGRQP